MSEIEIERLCEDVLRLDAEATPHWAQHDEYDRALVTVENPTMSLLALDRDDTALFDRAIDCETAAHYRTATRLSCCGVRWSGRGACCGGRLTCSWCVALTTSGSTNSRPRWEVQNEQGSYGYDSGQ